MTAFDVLEFKPIRIEQDRDVAVRFQIDAYKISFGDAQGFFEKFGETGDAYIRWLKELCVREPNSAMHLWQNGKIVGQIELGELKTEPHTGYVYLYYLVPQMRGQGAGNLLDAYATSYFHKSGFRKMRLSVTSQNQPAIRFYQRQGWRLAGEIPGRTGVLSMEKGIDRGPSPGVQI